MTSSVPSSSASLPPKMKKAELVGARQPLEIVMTDIPQPPPEGCIVRTTYSGVCHTDLHFIEDTLDIGGGATIKVTDFLKQRGMPLWGRVMGHEIAGIVESFGSKVEPEKLGVSVGDEVLVYPWLGCGDCSACHAGYNTACEFDIGAVSSMGFGCNPGGYSTHVPVPKCCYLIKLPATIPASVGCILPCSGLTAYVALKKTRPTIETALKKFGESRLLIIGAGGLGLWAIILAKVIYKGQKVVVSVADVSEKSLELAQQAGADNIILWNPNADLQASIAQTTNEGRAKIDAAIDFVGKETTTGITIQSLRKQGQLVVVGLFGGALVYPIPPLVLGMINVQGHIVGNPSDLEEFVAFVAENDVVYPRIEAHKLDDINEVLGKLKEGKITGRAVLKF